MVSQDPRVAPFAPFVAGYYLDVRGYHPPKNVMEKEFVSADQKMTVLLIQPTKNDGQIASANLFLRELCTTAPPGFTVHISGMLSVLSGEGCYGGVHATVNTVDMSFTGMAHAEAATLPFALLIITFTVRYVRFLILPVVLVFLTFVLSAILIIPWMGVVEVPSDSFVAMGSLIFALSLDYSLFFLSRFCEHRLQGWSIQRCVDSLVAHTGRTVATSGILVAIACFANLSSPEACMKGTALCTGMATLACIIASVLFYPAVLLLAGKPLTKTAMTTGSDAESSSLIQPAQEDDENIIDEPQHPSERSRRTAAVRRVRWHKAMLFIDKSPLGAIVIVLVAMSPMLVYLPQLNVTGDRFLLMPIDMPAAKAMHRIQADFPVGILDPYAIVITAPASVPPAQVKVELQLAIELLKAHTDVWSGLGLKGDQAKEISAALSSVSINDDANRAAITLENAEVNFTSFPSLKSLAHADCSTIAAVAAGAAAGMKKSAGIGDAEAFRAASRAGINTVKDLKRMRCCDADIREAIAGSATLLYARRREFPAEAKRIVQEEVRALNLREPVQSEFENAVEEAVGRESEYHTTASIGAEVGSAAGSGRSLSYTWTHIMDIVSESHLSLADRTKVVHAVSTLMSELHTDESPERLANRVHAEAARHGMSVFATSALTRAAAAAGSAEQDASVVQSGFAATNPAAPTALGDEWRVVLDAVDASSEFLNQSHGMMLMPSGFAAMLDLCNRVQEVGSVASMLAPSWAYKRSVDWVEAVAANADPKMRPVYRPVLDTHVNGHRALLEVHTTFPTLGAGSTEWAIATRIALIEWEKAHPGYTAELAGGATHFADLRAAVLTSMRSYLILTVLLVMSVVFLTFRSLMITLRLAFALVFTLAATYGAGVIVYQTPLLYGMFPFLANYNGLAVETVPAVTGVCIALGLDYDIFLVSRIVEFRSRGYSDRAAIFRGATQSGGVIAGAGLIMALCFSGLCFSDKVFFRQVGTLLVISVLFDTFVVRTVLVPALMLVAADMNWWPRKMPQASKDSIFDDDSDSCQEDAAAHSATQARVLSFSSQDCAEASLRPGDAT
eukprot:TRINITY_DN13693_c0_g2_i1.p1 TRINITY_DN13693_c0_g2~~TRINITY_DN13693_c0_g2_i1.p1  ORF type:complete len:1169 (-),score=134.09 TRINITY_DN13693_c0_g2_i1:26-3247(-)